MTMEGAGHSDTALTDLPPAPSMPCASISAEEQGKATGTMLMPCNLPEDKMNVLC